MFLKVFLYFCVFSFLFKMHFCVFLQKLVQRRFHEKLATQSFPRNQLKENKIFSISYKKSRYCLASISLLNPSPEMLFRQKLEIFQFHTEAIATVSRLFREYTLLAKWFLGKNWKIFNFIQRLSRLSHDCFVTKGFSRKLLCVS